LGAPGCSKTLIVKATSGEFGIPVIVMSIPDMLEKFVGFAAASDLCSRHR